MLNGLRFIAIILATLPVLANAQQFKVSKVKGNRAFIIMPKGMTLEKGKTYSVAEGDAGSDDDTQTSTQDRDTTMALSGNLFTGSTKTSPGGISVNGTSIELAGRYGWNKGKKEYGPLATFYYVSSGSYSARIIAGGGFFDYNLVENTAGQNKVYGLGADATFGLSSQSTGSSGTTGSVIQIKGGGQMKWFPVGPSAAIRVDAQLSYMRSAEDKITETQMGLYLAAGLQVYF